MSPRDLCVYLWYKKFKKSKIMEDKLKDVIVYDDFHNLWEKLFDEEIILDCDIDEEECLDYIEEVVYGGLIKNVDKSLSNDYIIEEYMKLYKKLKG